MKYAICSLLVLTLCTSALLAADAELVVEDAQGNEVLRLDPDDASTGPQNLPAGRYNLKVDGPGEFELLLGAQTVLEFRGGAEPPVTTHLAADDDASILIDFDPAEGDQGQRRAIVEGAGDEVELQLCAFDLPEIYGWSVSIEYDPDQVRYLSNSFEASTFVPELIPLVGERDMSVVVGGANFSKKITSGDGELGTLRFEVLDGFKGETGLKVTRFLRHSLRGTEVMDVETVALVASQEALDGDSGLDLATEVMDVETVALVASQEALDGDSGLDLAGDEAVDHLTAENACPGCDLSGVDLMRVQFPEADLDQADLSEANLSLANFSKARLADARLVEANLRLTDLRGADLRGADFSDAKLTWAKLQKANLQDAILDDANLNGANFSGAIWIDGSECAPGSVGRCK
ncbi:MAG TPA: pentapeptide repeat-containing protein [Candidatus Latescibacteria bacterium]|nr:pentapeptide repeat-containing protein [Candidatus Latescibacterota bacterium]